MKKKMLTFVLAGMFALGAVACGGNGDDTTTDPVDPAGGATDPVEITS